MDLLSEAAFLSLDCGKQVAQPERFLQGSHAWIAFCDGFQMRSGNCRDNYNGQIRTHHSHLMNDLLSSNISRKDQIDKQYIKWWWEGRWLLQMKRD